MASNFNLDAVSMVRLTYVSETINQLDAGELKSILSQAQGNNQTNGISGMLCFNNRRFLQTIEGSRARINRLYNALLNDTRHTNIQLLETVEIQTRMWGEWNMGYATPTKENQALFLKYSPVAEFNPYLLSAKTAQMLLMELATRLVKK